jgi:hypothetical protein
LRFLFRAKSLEVFWLAWSIMEPVIEIFSDVLAVRAGAALACSAHVVTEPEAYS